MLWFLLSVCLYKAFSGEAVTAVNRMVQYLGIIHSMKNSLNLHPGNSKRLSISGEGRNETKLSSFLPKSPAIRQPVTKSYWPVWRVTRL